MKNSINKTLPLILLGFSITAPALASDTVRVVVSKTEQLSGFSAAKDKSTKSASSASIVSESHPNYGCLATPNNNGSWCLPSVSKAKIQNAQFAAKNSASKNSASKKTARFETITLNSYGYSQKEIVNILNEDGRFGLVEADIKFDIYRGEDMASDFSGESSNVVNDPLYIPEQAHYMKDTLYSPVGSNIEAMWESAGTENIFNKKDPIDIVVIDTEFFESDEVEYFTGRNFSTVRLMPDSEPQEIGDNYQPPALVRELDKCGSHGMSVAGTVAAKMNNDVGLTGITNNARIHAIRASTCGSGYFADVAASLNWLAGESFDNVTPYSGKPGVVNISLDILNSATEEGERGCPVYLQTAVDRALDAGFTIVTAAGNDSRDVIRSVLASCLNKITVGALDVTGGLAYFSNYGNDVDIMAVGIDVGVYCGKLNDGKTCSSSGTSFSSPVVAAVLAVIKNETGANSELLKFAMKYAATKHTLDSSCPDGFCGAGLLNADNTFKIAKLAQNNELNTIAYALSGKDKCEQQWYIDNFGGIGRLCEMQKITFMGGIEKANTTFKLVSIPANGSWSTSTQTEEGVFSTTNASVFGLDVEGKQFGMSYCESGVCSSIQNVNTSKAAISEKPVACDD